MLTYEEAVRRHVCSHCIDYGEDGQCHSLDVSGCAIYRFLPELIGIAQKIRRSNMKSYQRAVRKCICRRCDHSKGKECSLRKELDCALDRYLPLVLDALDEVNVQ